MEDAVVRFDSRTGTSNTYTACIEGPCENQETQKAWPRNTYLMPQSFICMPRNSLDMRVLMSIYNIQNAKVK
jgi:hypothetical protein